MLIFLRVYLKAFGLDVDKVGSVDGKDFGIEKF